MKLAFKEVLPVALPVILLNLFFLWDSQFLDYLGGRGVFGAHACFNSVCYHTDLAYIMENGIYSFVGSVFVNPLMGAGPKVALLVGVDGVSLVCVVVLFLALFRRNSARGWKFAILKSVQLSDLCLIPLGLELLLDYMMNPNAENLGQLNEHVVTMQVYLGVLTDFTNLDLLYLTLAVFALTSLLLSRGTMRPIRRL